MSEPLSAAKRVPLYERIPEIYRVEDGKQIPAGQLEAFLALVEDMLGEVHKNIESLYHDLFIETCDDWVVPYIADLLGSSHLKGDPKAFRRDVADTIALRRRKGTLGAIEILTRNLTQWGVHAAEMFKSLAWAQHLNHQRPDAGGLPPYGLPTVDRHTPVRGGTAVLRDPATLALRGTPFDPLSYLPDFRTPDPGTVRFNLPNLAVFLWRLAAYRVELAPPVHRGTTVTGNAAPLAGRVVRFDLHPLGDPVRLFNIEAEEADGAEPAASDADRKPGPIHPARLHSMSPPLHRSKNEPASKGIGNLWLDLKTDTWKEWDGTTWNELDSLIVDELVSGGYGRPEAYVEVVGLGAGGAGGAAANTERALRFHVPAAAFPAFDPSEWTFRGANLFAWEQGLRRSLRNKEIAIDPLIGRAVIGVSSANQATRLSDELRITHTYGAVGPVGAHPVDRSAQAAQAAATFLVDGTPGKRLRDALAGVELPGPPVVVEIVDNGVHDFSPAAVPTSVNELGGPTLVVARRLEIRAADGKRPIVRLAAPLRFRAVSAQAAPDLEVRLAGLYLARGPVWTAGDPLVARADLGHLVLDGCTLDPGGAELCPDAARAPIHPGMRLRDADKVQLGVPLQLQLQRTVTGPLRIDSECKLTLEESIVDAGSGVNEDPLTAGYALTGATGATGAPAAPAAAWGPQLEVRGGATFFGRVRVECACGKGGIWTQPLEVLNNQTGCIKFSFFSGRGDRLPQTRSCVYGRGADPAFLRFVSEIFGQPEYAQLALNSDFRIRERGPGDDAMGAFGFLTEAHKWRNLQIRYREFMPVGVRPLLVPVT